MLEASGSIQLFMNKLPSQGDRQSDTALVLRKIRSINNVGNGPNEVPNPNEVDVWK